MFRIPPSPDLEGNQVHTATHERRDGLLDGGKRRFGVARLASDISVFDRLALDICLLRSSAAGMNVLRPPLRFVDAHGMVERPFALNDPPRFGSGGLTNLALLRSPFSYLLTSTKRLFSRD